MRASQNGHTEIVKILVKQEGIDINSKDIQLFLSIFILIIFYFKTIFRNSSNYTEQYLFMQPCLVTQKSSKYFLNKKELISMLRTFN